MARARFAMRWDAGRAFGTAGLVAGLVAGCGGGSSDRSGSSTSETTTIQVKGSDTMVNVAQAWAEEYKLVAPSVGVEVSGGGSGVGIAALERAQ